MTNRLGSSNESMAKALSAEADWEALNGDAREVLMQFFMHGPVYDGHLASKVGRDRLCDLELIERGHGFQWLTRRGVEVALCADVSSWEWDAPRKKQGCA